MEMRGCCGDESTWVKATLHGAYRKHTAKARAGARVRMTNILEAVTGAAALPLGLDLDLKMRR